MHDTLIDTAYLTIYSPASRPWSFLGIEAVTVLGAALTLRHALGARRAGDGGALFAWVSMFVYGVCLEIASYNAFPNFTHGQFTVMFYHRKLPLYVSAFYPMILYCGQRTVRRLGLSRWAEPLVIGFTVVMMDFPFDILGPDAGWWSWDAHDPNVHVRWHGVPVTSYYWHLTWGAILCAICRALDSRMQVLGGPGGARRFAWLLLAFPVAGVTMALGRGAFLPFDLLVPLGVPDGAIVLVGFAVALALLAFCKRAIATERDPLLFAVPCLFYSFHLWVGVSMRGQIANWGERMLVIAAATTFAAGLNFAVHRPRAVEIRRAA